MPSLVALTNIAEVLEVNPGGLLEPAEDQVHITPADYDPEQTEITTPVFNMRLTSPASGSDLEVHRLVLQPQAPGLEFKPHPGEVFGFVLEGKLSIVIEDEQIELEAGDSIHYDANQSYRLNCQGDELCTIIWCSSPPWNGMDAKIEAVVGNETDLSPTAKST